MYNTNTDIWLAGAFAVVIVDFSVYPFDTLKTRIQSPNYEKLYKDAATGSIKKHTLFRGLYQGVGSVLLATIPSSGAFFTTYEAMKSTLSHTPALPQPLAHALASSTGEAVSCFILTPAEVIKQNAQVIDMQGGMSPEKNNNKNKNTTKPTTTTTGKKAIPRPTSATIQALSKFRQKPWNLWKGYTALVGRNLPFTGLHFPIFESVRARLLKWRERGRKIREKGEEEERVKGQGQRQGKGQGQGPSRMLERALLTGLAASVSGGFASTVTTPIDVVKTRVMLAASEEVANRGIWAMGRQIYRDEGLRGLFRGGAIRSVWSAAALSIYLGIYEGGRLYLENRRRAQDGLPYVEDIDQSGEPV